MIQHKAPAGQSIFEFLIASTIFTIGVVTILLLTFDAHTVSRRSIERTQAVFLAKEGLEAARSIGNNSFTNLTDGTHGLSLSNNRWILSGTTDTQDQFARSISIRQPGSSEYEKEVTSTVSWAITPTQSKSVQLIETLTYWNHPPLTEIECFLADLTGASIEQGSAHKIIRNIWISNPSCGYPITLDKIVLEWNIPGNNLFKVRINSNFLWQGNAPTGTILDLVPNETLVSGAAAKEIDQLRWFQSILGSDIDVKFIMSDGSSEEFTIPAF
ncbi:MAG: hypothetical protein KBC98_02585 [Candidatus Pacebacteria bacterium]|nr:hypothetical protein [Candidatus Paceibacterota bacterium]